MEEQGSNKPEEEEKEEAEVEADVTMQTKDSNFFPDPVTPRHQAVVPHQLGKEQSKLKDKELRPMLLDHPTTPPVPGFHLRTPIELELRPPVASTSKRTLDIDVDGRFSVWIF